MEGFLYLPPVVKARGSPDQRWTALVIQTNTLINEQKLKN